MAKVLGLSVSTIRGRLKLNPHLKVLRAADSHTDVQKPPTVADTVVRAPLPAPGQKPPRIDKRRVARKDQLPGEAMVAVIEETEKLIHSGLRKFGVPEETLKSLRDLHAVNVTTGEFLAQSVMDIQDLYSIELYKLPARLEFIRKTYLEAQGVDPMVQMFWQKAYTEILEQLGKGKDRMIAGAEVIAAIMRGNKDSEKDGGKLPKKVKPAWRK